MGGWCQATAGGPERDLSPGQAPGLQGALETQAPSIPVSVPWHRSLPAAAHMSAARRWGWGTLQSSPPARSPGPALGSRVAVCSLSLGDSGQEAPGAGVAPVSLGCPPSVDRAWTSFSLVSLPELPILTLPASGLWSLEHQGRDAGCQELSSPPGHHGGPAPGGGGRGTRSSPALGEAEPVSPPSELQGPRHHRRADSARPVLP